jgi:cohesin complex subunit SCC1
MGPSDGIGSQDFHDFDLGINLDDEPNGVEASNGHDENMSVDESVGVGRDAQYHRDSIHSHLAQTGRDLDMDVLSNRSKSRGASEHPFGGDVDMDFTELTGMDLGDLGIGFDDMQLDKIEKSPGHTRASSRACKCYFILHLQPFSSICQLASPLSEPPATPAADESLPAEVPQEASKAKRKAREKKQIIDSVTELQDGPGAKVGRGRGGGLGAPMTKDVSNILTDHQFLPRSSVVMRLLTIRGDPLAHFLPTKVTSGNAFFCAAPPGLAPELAELFMRPLTGSLAPKRRGTSPEKGSNKRPRLDGSIHEDDIEHGRRAGSLAPSHLLGSDILGRHSVGPDGIIDFGDQTVGLDDYQLEVPDFDTGAGGNMDIDRARSKSLAPSALSRLSTPTPDGLVIEDGDETYADASCPIAMFDVRPSTQTQTQTQTQGTEGEAQSADNEGKGYSKNTVKALSIIRKELQPVAGHEEVDKMLSFRKMSDKVCLWHLLP